MTKCIADHATLKSTPALWATLHFDGIQLIPAYGEPGDADYEPAERYELRTCPCKSTLCVKIA